MNESHASHAPIEDEPRAISVLVIDDDAESREVMADLLRGAGYSVRTASNGHEGLNVLQEVRPALILLDVHMPIMDGPHFREAQRQDASWIGIPTVVMTSDPEVNATLDIAVETTLRKPIKVGALIALVERHCGPRRR